MEVKSYRLRFAQVRTSEDGGTTASDLIYLQL